MSAIGASGQLVTTDFPPGPRPEAKTESQDHPYIGMWVTGDGYIRHELRGDGRYDEARGTRESAWQGRYRVTGDIIQYWDDTGFYADGQFREGVLYHGGYLFTSCDTSTRFPSCLKCSHGTSRINTPPWPPSGRDGGPC
ncbi:MAG: Atu4866 domain-containing protein [Pseudomonadota bacterium]